MGALNSHRKRDVRNLILSFGYERYALFILIIAYVLNFLDRQIIAILAEPIKQDLGLTDTQVGLMTGLSFAIFYTALGIPVSILADKWNRAKLMSIALAVWSGMTMLCGVAANFIQLFLARIGVGIGEAGAAPASHSLISDLFPPEKRAGAMGAYGMAVPIGSFIAFVLGGWIAETLNWRFAFFLAGAPGIILAVVVWLTIREPRGDVSLREALKPSPDDSRPKVRTLLPALFKKTTYWRLVVSGVLLQFAGYGLTIFAAPFFVRSHGMGIAEIGLKLGVLIGAVGVTGAWLGGWLGDRLLKRSAGAPMNMLAVVFTASTPLVLIGLNVPNGDLALLFYGAPLFAASFYYGPTFSALQSLVRGATRAIAVAIYIAIASLIGLGFGPVLVGVLSDYFAGPAPSPADQADGLRKALQVLSLFNLGVGLMFFLAGRTIGRDSVET